VGAADIAGLLVATLGGFAVGLERQWSGHASGSAARFGGIRTFALLGGVAGLAGWLTALDLVALGVVLLAGATALVIVGYLAASRTDVDGTTEAAALVVLAAGTLSGAGYIALASAVIAATALLLLEKTRLHALVARIDDAPLRASARFAAMALIVLPLLPRGPYGPYDAVRPRELWTLVLFFSGLAFVGWIARRLVGLHRGLIVSGMLGGVISSTSTTLQFARDSRNAPGSGLALSAGAISASAVMLLRVTLVCAVLNPQLAWRLPTFLTGAFVCGVIAVLITWRRDETHAAASEEAGRSPLQLVAALQMTGLFQVVLLAILAVQARLGASALIATSAFVGLTDLDALTLSLARSTVNPVDLPASTTALLAGVVSNTLLKAGVALFVGQGMFRVLTTLVLVAMAAAVVLALLLV
jgi:uncharacterized membrane protein (DUF4010 family)